MFPSLKKSDLAKKKCLNFLWNGRISDGSFASEIDYETKAIFDPEISQARILHPFCQEELEGCEGVLMG